MTFFGVLLPGVLIPIISTNTTSNTVVGIVACFDDGAALNLSSSVLQGPVVIEDIHGEADLSIPNLHYIVITISRDTQEESQIQWEVSCTRDGMFSNVVTTNVTVSPNPLLPFITQFEREYCLPVNSPQGTQLFRVEAVVSSG